MSAVLEVTEREIYEGNLTLDHCSFCVILTNRERSVQVIPCLLNELP
jgi:hypothetical protein